MTTRHFVKQLKTLEAIKPRTEWSEKTRDILFSQIQAQGTSSQKRFHISGVGAYIQDTLSFVYRVSVGHLFDQPFVFSGILSVFVVAVVSATLASQTSIPGDPLYIVKRTHEQITAAIIPPEQQPALQLDLANNRIQELNALSHSALSSQEKGQAAQQLTETAQQNIADANAELEHLKKEAPQKAVQVASTVNDKAAQYEHDAHSVQNTAPSKQLNTLIAGLDTTQNKALAVIVDKKDSANLSDAQVAANINSAIQDLEGRLAQTEEVFAAGFAKNSSLGEKSDAAKKNLASAKDSVERNDFTVALDKISLSRTIITDIENTLDAKVTKTQQDTQSSDASKGDMELKSTIK